MTRMSVASDPITTLPMEIWYTYTVWKRPHTKKIIIDNEKQEAENVMYAHFKEYQEWIEEDT